MTKLARGFLEDRIEPEPNTGCWIWTGSVVQPRGYGRLSIGSRGSERVDLAHRLVYGTLRGQIPPGLEIDHLCRFPRCVNPAHLEAVTPAVNRGRRVFVTGPRLTRCRAGHPFNSANTLILRDEKRACRACARDRMRRFKERRMEVAS